MSKSVVLLLVLVSLTASCIVVVKPVWAPSLTENSWKTMADVPTGRLGPGVAVVNGKIYVIGGMGGGGYLNTNEEYNPATNTWATKKPMPTPRASFGITVYQNKIYCIGGSVDSFEGVIGANEVYDPLTDTWTTKTSMPTAREFLCANVVNGKIYLTGGSKFFNPNNPSFVPNVNEVYNPETDSWTTKTPPPVNVSNYASAVVNNKIYIISGSGDDDKLTLIYYPEADSWSYGAQIPTPVWGAAAGATTGVMAPKRIYVIGGYPTFNLNQVYNPEKNVWTMGTQMPTNRYGLGVAVVSDVIYAIGGPGADAMVANEQYTPVGYGASDFSSSPSPFQEPTSTPEPQRSDPFQTTLIIVAAATVAVVGVGLLFYFKKRKH